MKNKMLLNLLLVIGGLMSCGEKDILKSDVPDVYVINGDTIKSRVEKEISLLKERTRFIKSLVIVGDTTVFIPPVRPGAPPQSSPDLREFQRPENKGKPFQYYAYGSSLTAGFRDGGYFNDGMETSYPVLIARQMGLTDFKTPTFAHQNLNGVGRLVLTHFNPTGGPAPKFKLVNNNLGISVNTEKDFEMEKNREVSQLKNWAVANSERWQLLQLFKDGGENIFADRLGDNEYSVYCEKNPADLVTLESGYTDLVKMVNGEALAGSFDAIIPWGAIGNNEQRLAWGTTNLVTGERKRLLCVANIPDPMDTPLFYVVTAREVYNSLLVKRDLVFHSNTDLDNSVFLMNSTLDSLLSPRVSLALKEDIVVNKRTKLGGPMDVRAYYSEFVSNSVYNNMRYKNIEIEILSERYNFPVVDLHGLFKKIREGKFITDDGVQVEFKYPGGNFYSNDGFYPTAFGQAIIANEFIKALNKHYGMKIPLIKTREYLK